MAMFKWFYEHTKELDDNNIYAPVDGTLKNIDQASDPVFAAKVMGEGFIIEPDDGKVYAPVSGVVTDIACTKHAITIKMLNGLDILVHMGVNTVTLKGEPFTIEVNPEEMVKGGQAIAEMDLDAIKSAGLDDTVIVVVTNSETNLAKLNIDNKGLVQAGNIIGSVEAKK